MERRDFMALLGGAAALVPSIGATPARAGAPEHLLSGTWSFVSSIITRKDGSVVDRWGPNPRGMLMFDGVGHFTQIITGTESVMFGPKVFSGFGDYSFEHSKSVLNLNYSACSVAKLVGATQERKIAVLSADQLKYINFVATTESTVEVHWKRLA
jgi:hypothetical protein